MMQSIVRYHQDDEGSWVAVLGCGHGQHLRHDPPWMNREWVTIEQGRAAMIGFQLDCKKCEENAPKDFSQSPPEAC